MQPTSRKVASSASSRGELTQLFEAQWKIRDSHDQSGPSALWMYIQLHIGSASHVSQSGTNPHAQELIGKLSAMVDEVTRRAEREASLPTETGRSCYCTAAMLSGGPCNRKRVLVA